MNKVKPGPKKGYKQTEEHKRKVSEANKGKKKREIEGKCVLCGTRIERTILRKDATCFTCKVLAARIKSNKRNKNKKL